MANTFPVQHNVTESDQYKALSISAKVLYIMLCKHSNRYGNKNTDNWFGRSIRELSHDTNMSTKTITKARKELVTAYMIQIIADTEPDHTKRVSIRYRIITWERVRFKSNQYRKYSHTNYGRISHSLNKNTNVEIVQQSDNYYKAK